MAKPRFLNKKIVSVLSLLLPVLIQGVASGEEPFHIGTHPAGALVELKGEQTLRGHSPISLFPENQGDYRVRVEMARYETVYGSLSIRSRDGVLELAGAGASLRRERLFRSLLLPGSGQFREGRRQEGFFWGLTAFASGVTTLYLESRYRGAHEDFHESNTLLNGLFPTAPTGQGDDRVEYLSLLHETFRLEARAEMTLRDRNYSLGALAVTWGLNLLDAALFHSSLNLREGSDRVVQIRLDEKSGKKAVLRSLFYPGLGQSYRGQKARGFLYSTAATAAATTALVSHLRYRGELDRVETLDRELAALTPGGPLEADLSVAIAAERTVSAQAGEDDKDRRNIAVAIALGIYVGSALDALFGNAAPAAEETTTEIGFLAPVRSGTPGFGLRYRF